MCVSRRTRHSRPVRGATSAGGRKRKAERLAWVGITLLLVLALAGCALSPIREIRGARHYAEGTRALTASDGTTAVLELEQAAELVPQASEIQNHLGLAYWSLGRFEEAQTAFEAAIELDCENEAARVNLERLGRSNSVAADAASEGSGHGGG